MLLWMVLKFLNSLKAYKNKIDFYILTLCPATLLSSFTKMFCIDFWERQILFRLFKLCVVHFFPCLIALRKTSSLILNRSHNWRHPCHVLDLKENTLSFSSLSIMVTPFFFKTSFFRLRNFLISNLLRILSLMNVEFINKFLFLLRWSYGFSYLVC